MGPKFIKSEIVVMYILSLLVGLVFNQNLPQQIVNCLHHQALTSDMC
jgi:hypothetical protein